MFESSDNLPPPSSRQQDVATDTFSPYAAPESETTAASSSIEDRWPPPVTGSILLIACGMMLGLISLSTLSALNALVAVVMAGLGGGLLIRASRHAQR